MNLLPISEFDGFIFPVIDENYNMYIFVENNQDIKVLLNFTFLDFNKFVYIYKKSKELIPIGIYKPNLKLKVFCSGKDLFEFCTDEFKKHDFLYLSKFFIKNYEDYKKINFSLSFLDGCKITATSNFSQKLLIKFVDINSNKIIAEDIFSSEGLYKLNIHHYVNFEISVFNSNGNCIFKYYLNLNDKIVWFKLNSKDKDETLNLIKAVDSFRVSHNCKVLCTTFLNENFVHRFPSITFVGIDETIEENKIFAIYKINNIEEILGNKNI